MDTLKRIEESLRLTFSEEQRNVVRSYGQPISIVACAGAGKTTTLIAKLLYLELEHGVKPYEMLAISYTKKAVEEIEKRYIAARRQLKLKDYSPVFTTFHALFRRILMSVEEYKDIRVVDSSSYTYALTPHVKSIGVSDNTKRETVDSILRFRSYAINRGYTLNGEDIDMSRLNEAYTLGMTFNTTDYFKIVKEYNLLKQENNELDFDDLQGVCVYLLESSEYREQLLAEFGGSYSSILIDEYQDISPVQNKVMIQLIKEIGSQGLIVIGDDDQCQPAGTQVLMYGGYTKDIKDVKVGDRVVSYKAGHTPTLTNGNSLRGFKVNETSSRLVKGISTVITESGHESQYTDGHITYARVNKEYDLPTIYLLENDTGYKLGVAMFSQLNKELVSNNGFKLWKLGSFDSYTQAVEYCNLMAGNFSDTKDVKKVFHEYTSVREEYPFITRSNGDYIYDAISKSQAFQIRACNLEVGCMDKLVVDEQGKLTYSPIQTIYYNDEDEVKVYSLSVDDYSNYVADGIVTHNCIYKFRGAEPGIILDFEFTHLNAKRLFLATNYRCPYNILNFVAPSIEENTVRVKKDLQVAREGGLVGYIDTRYNYNGFIDEIRLDYLDMESREDLAILVRNNNQRTIIADILARNNIRVDIQTIKWSLYESSVYKRLTDIVRTIKRSDNYSFVRNHWIYAPHLKKDTIKHFERVDTLWVEEVYNNRLDLGYTRNNIVKQILQEDNAYDCIRLAYSLVSEHYTSGARKGYYNMDRVMETYNYCLKIAEGFTYDEFLKDSARIKSKLNGQIGRGKTIGVYTMHGVKGLEFKNVYIFNATDTYMLHGSRTTPETTEEERRLFYVAVTRAMEKVVFVHSSKEPTTFIDECHKGSEGLVTLVKHEETVGTPTVGIKEDVTEGIAINFSLDSLLMDTPAPTPSNTPETKPTPKQQHTQDAWDALVDRVKPKVTNEPKVSVKKISLQDINSLL